MRRSIPTITVKKFPTINPVATKAVLLDLDNTLYRYEPCHQHALRQSFLLFEKRSNSSIDMDKFAVLYRKHRNLVTKRLSPYAACRSRLFAFLHLLEEMKISSAFNLALDLESQYWKTFIGNLKITVLAESFLLDCKSKGMKLCIVSDMTASIQIRKIQQLGIREIIDYLVTSEEAGREKPFPDMFKLALKKMQLSPGEVIMIGDSKEKDVRGAQALGIKSFHVEA